MYFDQATNYEAEIFVDNCQSVKTVKIPSKSATYLKQQFIYGS